LPSTTRSMRRTFQLRRRLVGATPMKEPACVPVSCTHERMALKDLMKAGMLSEGGEVVPVKRLQETANHGLGFFFCRGHGSSVGSGIRVVHLPASRRTLAASRIPFGRPHRDCTDRQTSYLCSR
jgi:hypothetical protein